MAKTPKRDEAQGRRFQEAAHEAGVDESGEAFERAFGKIVPPKRRPVDVQKAKRKPSNG